MAIGQIPFGGLYTNAGELGLKNGFASSIINAYIDEFGNLRPIFYPTLLSQLTSSGAPHGVYWWNTEGVFIVLAGSKIFKITDKTGTFADITGTGVPQNLCKASFAEYGSVLYVADGGQIIKIPSGGTGSYLTDADAPTSVTHLGVLDKYLIAKNSGERFDYSEVLDPDSWPGTFASAESLPDNLNAIGISDMRVWLFGDISVETWRDDGVTPFVREYQGYIQRGISAPGTLAYCDNMWYFLSDQRYVVRLEGRLAKILSFPINDDIQRMEYVDDAIGNYVLFRGRPWYIIKFPTENRTFALDLTTSDRWVELAYWNSTQAKYVDYNLNMFAYSPQWNMLIAGSNASSNIYSLGSGDVTSGMRALYRTEHIDRGSVRVQKTCDSLTFRAQHYAAPSTDGVIMVRWQDNGSGKWSNWREVPLYRDTGTWLRGQIRRLGSYYTRMWEFVIPDGSPLVLSPPEEEYSGSP